MADLKNYRGRPYQYRINNKGFVCDDGDLFLPIVVDNKYDIVEDCPNELFCYWLDSKWVLDLNKAKLAQLQEIRDCRSDCWQKFDGLYNACERDLKQDETNQVLIDRLNACESLRACLKDIPVTAQTALDNATTIEEIEAICFKECLTIPDVIADDVAEYFN